jgi:outer membrane biosynthesis protein TonB
MRDCPHCATSISDNSRFCPECGRPLTEEAAATAIRSPARNWPPHPVMVIAVAIWVGSIVLLAAGVWAWGVVAFLAAGILVLTQREAERRAAKHALLGFRERFFATRDSVAARSRGHLELFRARRERAELEAERGRALHKLGHAVFYGEKAGTRSAKAEVQTIVDKITEKEAEIETLIRQIDVRVERAQISVKSTAKLKAEQPPEPARIPEPWPPPDEADIPEPAPAPEPSQEPQEPQEPEHPSAPQSRAKAKASSRRKS